MKSEERHHLQENDLAQKLGVWIGRIEPYFNQILIGILGVAVLVLGSFLWMRSSAAKSAESWAEFTKANVADDYATVADVHPNTEVGRWSKLLAAELYLNQALRAATSDKKTMEERMKLAEDSFNGLLQDGKTPGNIRERALYGLAIARESTSTGDTQPAIATYEELLKTFPNSRFAKIAQMRIDALRTDSTREFYAWLSQQPRNPEDRPQPRDLVAPRGDGESAPPFLIDDTAPKDGEAKTSDAAPMPETPGAAGEKMTDKPAATPATPMPEAPAAGTPPAEKPAPEKPAGDKPAAEAPAAEKPATEKPAAEKPAEKPAAEAPAAEKEKPAAPAEEKPAEAAPAADKPAENAPSADAPKSDAAP